MKMIIKRKRKRSFPLMLLFLMVTIILALSFIKYYSEKAYPIILNYSESEIKKFMALVINKSIGEAMDNMDTNDLFIIRYNSDGEIILLDFDSKKSSKILVDITNLIENNLKKIEDGDVDYYLDYYDANMLKDGVITEIPFGVIFNSSYLNNIGPKIPVKISFSRRIETGFSTDVVEYGINNALLKLNIDIKVSVKVILPFISNDLNTNFSIPLAMKVIQGKIPSYYMNGFTTKSNIIDGS